MDGIGTAVQTATATIVTVTVTEIAGETETGTAIAIATKIVNPEAARTGMRDRGAETDLPKGAEAAGVDCLPRDDAANIQRRPGLADVAGSRTTPIALTPWTAGETRVETVVEPGACPRRTS